MCDLAFLVHMDLETLAQACADINVLLLLQLHKTTVAIQCVCWATSTLLISGAGDHVMLRDYKRSVTTMSIQIIKNHYLLFLGESC